MIKVIIADDETILRNGLKTILEQNSDIDVCGLAKNGQEAFELCKKKSPDLVLMDIKMPQCNGPEAAKLIKAANRNIRILFLTTFSDKQSVMSALNSGADGYILKDVNEEKLLSAIKSTMAGICVLGSEAYENIKVKFCNNSDKILNLTDREKELLTLIAHGYNNKEIAVRMYLSDGTVRNNISLLLDKLKLKDRTQLAVFAVKNDLD